MFIFSSVAECSGQVMNCRVGITVDQGTIADADGITLLHYAAASNELEIATFLVPKVAKTSAKDDAGKTSLHVPAQDCQAGESCLVLAQFLLKKGAKKSSVDADGNTAGGYAVARGDGLVPRRRQVVWVQSGSTST